MATTNRASFDEATEDFYLHLVDMDAGQEVYLQGRRFYKGYDGRLHLHSCQLSLELLELLSKETPPALETAQRALRAIAYLADFILDEDENK